VSEHIRTQLADGVLTLTLDRADKKNAITQAMYAVLDTERAQLTFHRVPYDHYSAAAAIRRHGHARRGTAENTEGTQHGLARETCRQDALHRAHVALGLGLDPHPPVA